MPKLNAENDLRLIEAGFPCHQVGAETQRERGASSALPPLYYLHVWWARRPLTPSRAAVLASLLPAGADPDRFLRELGIEKVQAMVNGAPWTLEGRLLEKVKKNDFGQEGLFVDAQAVKALEGEQQTREEHRAAIKAIVRRRPLLDKDPVIRKWWELSIPIPEPFPAEGEILPVRRNAADPNWFSKLMETAKSVGLRVPNLYGYARAYLEKQAAGREQAVLDLLIVWTAEMSDEKLRQEAGAILFGLK